MTDQPTRMPPLTTERLVIREHLLEDIDALHEILDVDRGDDHPARTRAERERRTRWMIENYFQVASVDQLPHAEWSIVETEKGTVVGVIGMQPQPGPFERLAAWQHPGVEPDADRMLIEMGMFWALGKPYRGKGYATEAARALIDYGFRGIGLKRMIATTEYDNLASQAVMRRLGMTIERNPREDPFWLQIVAVIENTA